MLGKIPPVISFRLDFCVDGKLENVLYCIT